MQRTTRAEAQRIASGAEPQASVLRYEVRRGDSLWTIARDHNTTVERLRTANKLRTSRIFTGQVLEVPLGGA